MSICASHAVAASPPAPPPNHTHMHCYTCWCLLPLLPLYRFSADSYRPTFLPSPYRSLFESSERRAAAASKPSPPPTHTLAPLLRSLFEASERRAAATSKPSSGRSLLESIDDSGGDDALGGGSDGPRLLLELTLSPTRTTFTALSAPDGGGDCLLEVRFPASVRCPHQYAEASSPSPSVAASAALLHGGTNEGMDRLRGGRGLLSAAGSPHPPAGRDGSVGRLLVAAGSPHPPAGDGAVLDAGGRSRFVFWLQADYVGKEGGTGGCDGRGGTGEE